jgi:hypothetical protein
MRMESDIHKLYEEFSPSKERPVKIPRQDVVKFMEGKDYIIVGMCNYGFLDLILMWTGFLERLDIKNYLIFTPDRRLYARLREEKINTYLIECNEEMPSSKQDFRTPGFNKLTYLKMYVVYGLLRHGLNVLFSDVDTIWFGNPEEDLKAGDDFDLQIQLDTHDFRLKEPVPELRYNTGIIYAKSGEKTVSFFRKILEKMLETPGMDDQTCLNEVIKENRDWISISAPGSRSTGDETRLQMGVLDPLRFPNGYIYFRDRFNYTRFNASPVIVHANFFGSLDEKAEILRMFGCWNKMSKTEKIYWGVKKTWFWIRIIIQRLHLKMQNL